MKRTVYVAIPGDTELTARTVDGLSDLQALVGGPIEAVPLFEDFTVWVNEEGKLQELDFTMEMPEMRDVALGPVVFDGGTDEDGNTLQMTEDQINRAKAYFEKNYILHILPPRKNVL